MQNTYSFTHDGKLYGFRFGMNAFAAFTLQKGIVLAELGEYAFTLADLLDLFWHAHQAYCTSKAVAGATNRHELVDLIEDEGKFAELQEKIFEQMQNVAPEPAKKKTVQQRLTKSK